MGADGSQAYEWQHANERHKQTFFRVRICSKAYGLFPKVKRLPRASLLSEEATRVRVTRRTPWEK